MYKVKNQVPLTFFLFLFFLMNVQQISFLKGENMTLLLRGKYDIFPKKNVFLCEPKLKDKKSLLFPSLFPFPFSIFSLGEKNIIFFIFPKKGLLSLLCELKPAD